MGNATDAKAVCPQHVRVICSPSVLARTNIPKLEAQPNQTLRTLILFGPALKLRPKDGCARGPRHQHGIEIAKTAPGGQRTLQIGS
jgi:hypothetical protein